MLNILDIKERGFELRLDVDASVPAVIFSGNGDTEAIEPLGRFLQLLHKEVLVHEYKSIAVDLTQLYFMNSSCLKAFVSWIYKVNTTGRPYEIRLRSNPRLHWQKRSLATLQRLAPEIVFLDSVPSMAPSSP